MEQTLCEVLAEVVQRIGSRSRLKMRSEDEPEPWSDWLIAPTAGYLEAAGCGPWPCREMEWVEVEPGASGVGSLAATFGEAGLLAVVIGGVVRVACEVRGGRP